MSLILAQATAIQRVLDERMNEAALSQDVFESTLLCCAGLLEVGQAPVAKQLIARIEDLAARRPAEDVARLSVLRLRADFMTFSNVEMLTHAREAIAVCESAD